MKNKFSGLIAVAALAVAMASTASATELCAGEGNVAADLGPGNAIGGCTVTGSTLIFNNFTVSPSDGFSAGTTVGIGTTGTEVTGGDVDLAFQILASGPGAPDLGDVELQYTVEGGIEGVDLALQASPVAPGGLVTVTEVACSEAFVAGVCSGVTLANYTAISSGNAVVDSEVFIPSYSGEVFIKKDIAYDGATTSELTNSVIIPEPMTFSLMGAGLLGLGLLGRRLRK